MSTSTPTGPGRLLRLTLSIYRNESNSSIEEREKFAREYLAKVAGIVARHGMEAYQQVYTPAPLRAALEESGRRNKRNWVVDDHDLTVEFYFRHFAAMNKVSSDPEFRELQAAEGPYVNLIHTVATLGWVEKYLDGGKIVNIDENGKSTYPPWSELGDLASIFPTRPTDGSAARYYMDNEKNGVKKETSQEAPQPQPQVEPEPQPQPVPVLQSQPEPVSVPQAQ